MAEMISADLIQGEEINPKVLDQFVGSAITHAEGSLGVVISPDHIIQYSSPALRSLFPPGTDWYTFDDACIEIRQAGVSDG